MVSFIPVLLELHQSEPSDHLSSALVLIRVFAYRYSMYLKITRSCLIQDTCETIIFSAFT